MSADIGFRNEGPDDIEFLYRLYASTRAQELALVDWGKPQKDAFLRSQYQLQAAHYSRAYPDASFRLITERGDPIGRLYVHRTAQGIHIIDIALIPERRGAGIGTALMRDLIAEADAEQKTLSLYVEKFNPAQHLYERLGFHPVKDEGVYWYIERPPAPLAAAESSGAAEDSGPGE